MLKGESRNQLDTGPVLPDEARAGFRKLKECFYRSTLLRHFNSNLIKLETDAPGFAMSAVISQLQREPVLAFYRILF